MAKDSYSLLIMIAPKQYDSESGGQQLSEFARL